MLVAVFYCTKILYESFKKMLIAMMKPKQVLTRTNHRLRFFNCTRSRCITLLI